MVGEAKQGEVVPAKTEVNLEDLVHAAQPIVERWAQAQITTEQEKTKRRLAQLASEERVQLAEITADDQRESRAFRKDVVMFLSAEALFVVVLVYGMWRADLAFVWSALTGFVSLAGGYGIGRYQRPETSE